MGKDIDVLDFARRISMLTAPTPLADAYDAAHGQEKRRWWSSQREHLTVWCLHYPTGGVKGFTHKPSNSASTMYNHFGRPETLLWLIEALGEEEATIKDIINSIENVQNASSACAIIRQTIPFERVLLLLDK